MFGWFALCCILGLGETVTTTPNYESSDHGSESQNGNSTDVVAFGHVALTSVVWQAEYNDTTSPEFQAIKHSVSEMVVTKVTADALDEVFIDFQMQLIQPRSGGIGITFYMVLRINGDTDIETVVLDVADQLNQIENFENATVTETLFVREHPDEDHSNYFSVMSVHGRVTFTSQQWQTGFNDNSSQEFKILNFNVTEMVTEKVQQEGLEDDFLDFKVLSATPGDEGVVLTFLLVLKIYDDADLEAIPADVKYYLNDIENFQNATVTDTDFVSEYQDSDKKYTNNVEGSADHMGNSLVMKVHGRVTFTSQQWQTGFNDNSSQEFRIINYNVTEMVTAKAQEEGLEDDLLDFKVLSATPGDEGVVLTFLMVLKIDEDTNVEIIPWNVTYHLNDIEYLQNATVTDTDFVGEYRDSDKEYTNEFESSADHLENPSVMNVHGRVTFTAQQWQTEFNNNSSKEFNVLNYNVTGMITSKAQEEGVEEDFLDFKVLSATPGDEGVVLVFLMVLKIESDTDVETIPSDVTYYLNDIENLQNATVTEMDFVGEYQDSEKEYTNNDESSAGHMENYSVMAVHGHVTFTSQQWQTELNDNSSQEFTILNYNVTEMVRTKAQEELLEDELLDFKVLSATPGGEGLVLTFLMVLKIYDETDVETIPSNVTYHLNNIENLQDASVTETNFVDGYKDSDTEYINEGEGSADHMGNSSVMKVHGRVTFISQQWQTGFNDNSSQEFRVLNYNVTEMVILKAQDEGLEQDLLDFKVLFATPGEEGVVLTFLMVLKIDADVETIPSDVTDHLNDIENLQNATVTEMEFVGEYQDSDKEYMKDVESSADHMENSSVIEVHGHVTFTSQQWQTELNDNSSQEFTILNYNVSELVRCRAQEEGLEDDLLYFKVLSATPGDEGVVLTFLMVLKIDEDTNVEIIPWNVTYHLNDIEYLQNATVTDTDFVGEYRDSDKEYTNEFESSADHLENPSVMNVHGRVTFTAQQWQTEFNNNSSKEFNVLNYNVTGMVTSKAQEEGVEEDFLDFKVLSATPGDEGVVLMFLMVLKIDSDTDVETIPSDVTYYLNDIENFQNATVTEMDFVGEYQGSEKEYTNNDESSADHMENYSVMAVHGHVTFTSQQWQTELNDNSSQEFTILNYNVTELVRTKAQEEGLEDELLDFKVLSATPGGEGIVLTFLMVLKIYDETDVEKIPSNVTYHLNNIENLQDASVTETHFVDGYKDSDTEYINEGEGSAEHMANSSVMKVHGRVTFISQQWQTGFNDNSSQEFRVLNYNVTEMVISKAQDDGLEQDLLDFKVLFATPGEEGVVLTFLIVLKIDADADVETIPSDVTDHLNDIENLQNATVTEMEFVGEYQDSDKEYMNDVESSADHMENSSVMEVHGHVTFTSQQWQTELNDNSSQEFTILNYNVSELVRAKAQEEGLEDDLLDFKVLSATPGGEGLVLTFLMVLKIYDETDVETIPSNVTNHLNDIENLQDASVTETNFVDEYRNSDTEYTNEGESSADSMENSPVMNVHGRVTFTSQQWQTGFNDNSSQEFNILNYNVTEMVTSKAHDEGLEQDLLDFKVLFATPGEEGVVLTFLMVLKIDNDTDVETIPTDVTYHLNDIENLQNATVTDTDFVAEYQDSDQEITNEDESSADHMDNSSVKTITQLNVTFTTGVVFAQAVPKLALYCNYETQTEYEYISVWYADDEPIYTSERLPGDNIDSSYVISDDVSLSGFALEKAFKCSANVYRPEDNEPILRTFSQEFRPIEFEATEYEMERGRVLSFGIHIGIPLLCQHGSTCYVDLKLIDPDEDNQCQDSSLAFVNTHTCGQRIMGSSNYSKVVGEKMIKMTTRNDQQYDLKSHFRFLITFEPNDGAEDYWRGTFTTEFTVQVNDNKDFWKTMNAFSMNDPRICVHGYICFSLNQAGDFLFYRNKQDRVEVQIATEECLWGGFCTCGVIVRAGKDVYMIDHCSKFHTTSYLSSSGNSNLYIREEFPGYYKIFLPRGTMVTVGVMPPSLFDFAIMNVGLFPSPYDVENVEGLCGDVSYSNWAGLVHSDGSTTPVDSWWLWDDPVDFINSWRLSDTESLWYMMSNDIELDDLEEDATMCVCTGTDEADDVLCSKQEKRLCVDEDNVNNELPGKTKNEAQLRKRMERRNEVRETQIQTRRKREVGSSNNIDFDTAFDMCRSSMNNKCAILISQTDSEMIVNNTYSIVACAYDKMENSSVNWEDSACIDAANKVSVIIGKDHSLPADKVTNVEETYCPNSCSGKGDCIEKKCHCYDGYSNRDCGVQLTKLLDVKSLGNGLCDVPCDYIYIQGEGFSPDAICRIYHKQINTNNEVKYIGYIDCLLHYESTYEAYVEVPSRRRRRSSDNNTNVVAEVYEVSVSNDGNAFGSSSEVIALDASCLTYSGTGDNITIILDSNYCLIDGLCYQDGTNLTGQTCNFCDRSLDPYSWTLHSDFCLIDDVCYPNGTLKSSHSCKFCLTTADPTDWTTDNETDSCMDKGSSDDSGIKGHVIAIIVLTVLLVVGGGGVGGYFLMKKYQASKAMGKGLFDNVKRPRFSLRIEPSKTTLIDPERKDHPPPDLYQQYDIPRTPTDRVPDNLYTERDTVDHRLPEPILPNMP